MYDTPLSPMRRVFLLLAALAAGLVACDDTFVRPLVPRHDGNSGDSETTDYDDACLIGAFYEVDGDELSLRAFSTYSFAADASGGDCGGQGGPTGLGTCAQLDGYDGTVQVLLGGQVVAELTYDGAYLAEGGVEVLAYEAPDGTQVEYHVYTTAECPEAPPGSVLTRSEVEELES